MEELHERLAYARSKAGFKNASDAARYYGWNENTYRSHEGGVRGFRAETAEKYARAFKVSVDWLYFNIEKPGPSSQQEELIALVKRMDAELTQTMLAMAKRSMKA